jgi:hypothetical protein
MEAPGVEGVFRGTDSGVMKSNLDVECYDFTDTHQSLRVTTAMAVF